MPPCNPRAAPRFPIDCTINKQRCKPGDKFSLRTMTDRQSRGNKDGRDDDNSLHTLGVNRSIVSFRIRKPASFDQAWPCARTKGVPTGPASTQAGASSTRRQFDSPGCCPDPRVFPGDVMKVPAIFLVQACCLGVWTLYHGCIVSPPCALSCGATRRHIDAKRSFHIDRLWPCPSAASSTGLPCVCLTGFSPRKRMIRPMRCLPLKREYGRRQSKRQCAHAEQ